VLINNSYDPYSVVDESSAGYKYSV
jgi:hypothetical protein